MRARLALKSVVLATSIATLSACLSGCASSQLTTSGALSSYDGLTPTDGVVAKSKLSINKADVLAARTIATTPTSFAAGALAPQLTEEQRHVIANAVDRSLCIGVSDRFVVVPRGERADLTV